MQEQSAKSESYESFPPVACCLVPIACHRHRITRSALANTFGGIVNPICLAVFRLITISNFVDCSTGKSAGFVPLRILSTIDATRR